MDIVTYALAKKLVNGVQSGLANATVDNTNCSITFNWTNGTSSTLTFPKPADGVSITNAYIDDTNHLMMELSSGATIDAGVITGGDGGSYDDTAIKADIADLQADITNINTDITTVKNDLATAKTDIDTLEADVDGLQDKEIDTVTYADNKLTLTHKDGTAKEVTIQPKLVNLADVDITSPNSGDVVTYSASTGKFTTGQVSSTDQYVKMTATDTNAAYLEDLIDDDTIKNNAGKLEVEKIKGQNITVDELNTLLGMDANVKDALNALASGGMVFKDVVPTHADLPQTATNGFVYIVNADETDNGNRNAYIYSDDHAGFVLIGSSGIEIRNFQTNPIDLTSEVINVLPKDKMETTDLVDKTKDVINTLSYPIPNEDLEKIPNLEVLKQINTEVINALNGKMNNTDIVDNLTDNSVDKPLSANQGNVLDTKIGHKIDNDKIVTTLDSTVTDEQIPSAKVTHNELSKKVDKTDITTTIDNTSTDTQVPSAKAVYNATVDKNLKTYTSIKQLGLTEGSETLSDIATNMSNNSMAILNVQSSCNVSEYPVGYGVLTVNKLNINRVSFIFTETDGASTLRQWFASYNGGKLNGWKRVCTTTVNDVAKTKFAFTDTSVYKNGNSVLNWYEVKNGICYFCINILCVGTPTSTIIGTLPIPKGRYGDIVYAYQNGGTGSIQFTIKENTGELLVSRGNLNDYYIIKGSYPVAE